MGPLANGSPEARVHGPMGPQRPTLGSHGGVPGFPWGVPGFPWGVPGIPWGGPRDPMGGPRDPRGKKEMENIKKIEKIKKDML